MSGEGCAVLSPPVLEEAHTQYAIDRTMPEDDWRAWVATTDLVIRRKYLVGYW
jgi:hypothetical protein